MSTSVGKFTAQAGVAAARLSADSCTVKADPQKIISTSNTLKRKIDKLQYVFDTMVDTVNQTANYWQGDASETYRNDFKEERPEFEEAFRRMLEHVEDLNTIASQYIDAEEKAIDLTESLLSDVID